MGGWQLVYFYRPPSCIPADFNLLDSFDWPSAADCGAAGREPATVDGYAIWAGDERDVAPVLAEFEGFGDVPVWIVATDD